ncbi:MAG: tRNA pseudouridine(55) synthase TruB, partial [Epsilonproteobacteria bacterium]|nr:tRNA pseudouridine(55) synthase TruB [Campylobacterota bacterium]
MNRLFVAYKPARISSNQLLGRLKRRYGVKKAGYSGTLDPFAKGVLIVAFGNHGRLFRFLNKTPKRYRATLWLGAYSPTLDIEKIETIDHVAPVSEEEICNACTSLIGELTYLPPKYSAKKIDGRRAYELAREGKEVDMRAITSTIYDLSLIHYCHPFITFEATVSEGSYIRSIGEIIAHRLGCNGSLSALERLNEGQFV